MILPGGTSTARLAGIVFAGTLSACAGTLSGSVGDVPAGPKMEMGGRWLLIAPKAPTCGMAFGESGSIAPDGGCPGNFFTSRRWALEGSELTILDDNDQPLAQLRFVGGRFEGKAASGMTVTLARTILPSN